MANQNSVQDKIDYYSKRVNNPKLTEGQRKHAAKRLNQLLSGKKSNRSSAPASIAPGNYTPAQKQANVAGIAYGLAKTGRQMQVRPENQEAFRNGVQAGRAGKGAKK